MQGDDEMVKEVPANAEAESAVLGLCLQYPASISAGVGAGITEASFVYANHKATWAAMVAMDERGRLGKAPLSPLLVWEECKKLGRGGDVTSIVQISHLMTEVATSQSARQLFEALREWEHRRELYILGLDLGKNSEDPSYKVESIISAIDERVANIRQLNIRGVEQMSAVVEDALEYIRQSTEAGSVGITLGMPDLDRILGGAGPGDLVIVAGRPSEGKSALTWQMCQHVAGKHGPVALFSLEMSARQMVLRTLCSELGLSREDILLGKVPQHLEAKYLSVLEHLARMPIHLDARGGISISQIRSRATTLHRRKPLAMVCVDYLQLVKGPAKGNREQEVGDVSRALKAIAMDLQVVMLVPCQLNRASLSRTDPRPQLQDLRESGSIEQDADAVVFIYHPNWAKDRLANIDLGECELIVRKNRNGRVGISQVWWSHERALFRSRAHGDRMVRLQQAPEEDLPPYLQEEDGFVA